MIEASHVVDVLTGELVELPCEREHVDGRTVTITGIASAPTMAPPSLGRLRLAAGGVCIPELVYLSIVVYPGGRRG